MKPTIIRTVALALAAVGMHAAYSDPDVNDDGVVNFLDVSEFSRCFQVSIFDDSSCAAVDQDGDLIINFLDFPGFRDFFLQPYPAPDLSERYFPSLILPIDSRVYVSGLDINNDGNRDIFGVSPAVLGNTFSIGFGDGAGNFSGTSVHYAQCGQSGQRIESGELLHLNDDEHIDFVAICSEDSEIDYLNTFISSGDGVFEFESEFELTTNGFTIQVADYNGDGRDDVFASSPVGSSIFGVVQVFENGLVNDLAFAGSLDFTMSLNHVSVADVNQDNFADLVTVEREAACCDRNAFVRLGDGSGGFGAPQTVISLVGSQWVKAVDINGDNFLDVVTCCTPHSKYAFGDGQGGFTPHPFLYGPQGNDFLLEFAELNSASFVEQITLGSDRRTYTLSFYTNLPPGGAGLIPKTPVSQLSSLAARTRLRDVGSDGFPDLLSPQTSGTLYISTLINPLTGILDLNQGGFRSFNIGPQKILSADFNGDGKPDLAGIATVGSGMKLGVSLANNQGGFFSSVYEADGFRGIDLAAGDLNGDGITDLAVARGGVNSDLTSVFFGDEPGQFIEGPDIELGGRYATVADVDGDELDELLVAPFNATQIDVLKRNALGDFVVVESVATAEDATFDSADIDQDGISDLLVENGNTLTVYLGTSGQGLVEQASISTTDAEDETLTFGVFTVGHLDQDGVHDLAVVQASSGEGLDQIQQYKGNGSGGFELESSYPIADTEDFLTPYDVRIGDIDNDGFNDVVLTSGALRHTTIYFGLGDFTSDREQRYAPIYSDGSGGLGSSMELVDMDLDGRVDIVHGIYGSFDGYRILYNKIQ